MISTDFNIYVNNIHVFLLSILSICIPFLQINIKKLLLLFIQHVSLCVFLSWNAVEPFHNDAKTLIT